jgi:hypothetical protein
LSWGKSNPSCLKAPRWEEPVLTGLGPVDDDWHNVTRVKNIKLVLFFLVIVGIKSGSQPRTVIFSVTKYKTSWIHKNVNNIFLLACWPKLGRFQYLFQRIYYFRWSKQFFVIRNAFSFPHNFVTTKKPRHFLIKIWKEG